ncbi:MAG: ROK family protein [archaeon]|nr:MAG: ROK family protein [archaeon]
MKKYIVFDIGGTKTRYAVMDREANFLYGPFEENTPKKGLPDLLVGIVGKILNKTEFEVVESIGIACCGIIDTERGMIKHSRILGDRIEIRSPLEKKFRIKTFVENDGNAAVLGEKFYGKGKKFESVAYVSIGTGLGGGFYKKGLHRGGEYDTEFGSFDVGGVEWKSISGSKIKELLEEFLSEDKRETGLRQESLNAENLFALAAEGDRVVKEFLENVIGKYNARGFSIIIKKFEPEMIVLGGSIALENSGMIIEPLKRRLKKILGGRKLPRIELSGLGKNAGLYGALVLAKR